MRREPGQPPRSIGVNYLPGTGDMMAYGGVVLAALGVLTWVVRGDPIFLWMVPIGVGAAAYFYPLIEKGVVRLGADSRGLYFERLGIIPWGSIKQVRHKQRALRNLRLHTLEVDVSGPLREVAIDQEPEPIWKRYMSKAWSADGETISVELHPLAKDPTDFLEHLFAFRPELLAAAKQARESAD